MIQVQGFQSWGNVWVALYLTHVQGVEAAVVLVLFPPTDLALLGEELIDELEGLDDVVLWASKRRVLLQRHLQMFNVVS